MGEKEVVNMAERVMGQQGHLERTWGELEKEQVWTGRDELILRHAAEL